MLSRREEGVAEDDGESISKRLKVSHQFSLSSAFGNYASMLDKRHQAKENISVISRTITALSKKVIFQLHRETIPGVDSQSEILKAEMMLRGIADDNICGALAAELRLVDPYLYRHSFSVGLQEFVEAVSLWWYLKHERDSTTIDGNWCALLVPLDFITTTYLTASDAFVVPLSLEDYLLGICDLSGELMRLATNSAVQPDRVLRVNLFHRSMLMSFCNGSGGDATTDAGGDTMEDANDSATVTIRSIKFLVNGMPSKIKVMQECMQKLDKIVVSQVIRQSERALRGL